MMQAGGGLEGRAGGGAGGQETRDIGGSGNRLRGYAAGAELGPAVALGERRQERARFAEGDLEAGGDAGGRKRFHAFDVAGRNRLHLDGIDQGGGGSGGMRGAV